MMRQPLTEIAAHGNVYHRIFPIILSDALIYKPVPRIHYVKYWEQQIKEMDERKVLQDTAKDLHLISVVISTASTHAQREKAHKQLRTCRNNALERLKHSKKFDASFLSAILLAIDLHITTTAVTYTGEQRSVLKGKNRLPETTKSLSACTITLPSMMQNRKAYKTLIEEVRSIFTHPADNNWWEKETKAYLKRHADQVILEITARNEGYPVFKMPSEEKYEALQKCRPI